MSCARRSRLINPPRYDRIRRLTYLFSTTSTDPSSQYDWPPRDPYSSQERAIARDARERARARLAATSSSPFTEGTLLHPSSSSTTAEPSSTLRHRIPKRANVSPYHQDYEAPGSSCSSSSSAGGSSSGSDLDDEDIPLSDLARYGRGGGGPLAPPPTAAPPPAVRIRRGSEGYEVRPLGFGRGRSLSVSSLVEGDDGFSDHSWEEGRISEGELDEEGDRRRVGPRYKRYVAEVESESESESERDSMDSYLEENHAVLL